MYQNTICISLNAKVEEVCLDVLSPVMWVTPKEIPGTDWNVTFYFAGYINNNFGTGLYLF